MDAKIRRCIARAEKGEHLSRKEVEQNIRRIDKGRARLVKFSLTANGGSLVPTIS